MTTSCCPSYTNLVRKHLPELTPFVSDTHSPMYYTAELAREKYPDATLVFIGPCLAKRREAYTDPNADLMLNFEEIASMFVAARIEVNHVRGDKLDAAVEETSRRYAVTTGVMGAVRERLGNPADIRPIVINGLDKASIRELKGYVKSCPGNMVEVMACEGGCVSGCNVIANPKTATRQINDLPKGV